MSSDFSKPVSRTAEPMQLIAIRLADPMATGPRAALRRMNPGALATPALQRLLALAVPPGTPGTEPAWALLIHLLALGAPRQHQGGARLGAALQAADFKEGRLVRLLDRRADPLVVLPRTVRFLIAKNERLHAQDLWTLIWPALRPTPDEDALEAARTQVARDYYRAAPIDGTSHAASQLETAS